MRIITPSYYIATNNSLKNNKQTTTYTKNSSINQSFGGTNPPLKNKSAGILGAVIIGISALTGFHNCKNTDEAPYQIVKEGDIASKIALDNHITTDELQKYNPNKNLDKIYPGDTIYLGQKKKHKNNIVTPIKITESFSDGKDTATIKIKGDCFISTYRDLSDRDKHGILYANINDGNVDIKQNNGDITVVNFGKSNYNLLKKIAKKSIFSQSYQLSPEDLKRFVSENMKNGDIKCGNITYQVNYDEKENTLELVPYYGHTLLTISFSRNPEYADEMLSYYNEIQEFQNNQSEYKMQTGNSPAQLEKRWKSNVKATKKLPYEFFVRVVEISDHINYDPEDLMAIIRLETAGTFSPSVKCNDKNSTAVGLIQFIEGTANDLGKKADAIKYMHYKKGKTVDEIAKKCGYTPTTVRNILKIKYDSKNMRESLLKMSAVEQLNFVEMYLVNTIKTCRIHVKDRADAYCVILCPGNANKKYPLMKKRDGDSYTRNKGLDKNKDGIISYDELFEFVTSRRCDK